MVTALGRIIYALPFFQPFGMQWIHGYRCHKKKCRHPTQSFFVCSPFQCGEGQSVVKAWGRGGRAKDLRGLVMDLNAAAGRGEDLTATLRKAAASTSTTTPPLPPPLRQARDGHNHGAPAALSRNRDHHGRAASLSTGGGGGIALQARRFAEGTADADPVNNRQARFCFDEPRLDKQRYDEPHGVLDEPRFDEPRLNEQRFDEQRFDERRFDERRFDECRFDEERRFDEPAALGFTSGRNRRDREICDSLGARAAGDTLRGGIRSAGEGEQHVRHERRNTEYADDANLGTTTGRDYPACDSVGVDSFGEQTPTPRQSALEPTGRGAKASRWGAFASGRGRGVDCLEKHGRGQTEFGQQVNAPIFRGVVCVCGLAF